MVTSMLMSSLVVWLYTKIGQQSVLKWGKISTFNEAFQFSAKIAHLFAMEGHFWRLFIADPCFYLPLPLPLSLNHPFRSRSTSLAAGAVLLARDSNHSLDWAATHSNLPWPIPRKNRVESCATTTLSIFILPLCFLFIPLPSASGSNQVCTTKPETARVMACEVALDWIWGEMEKGRSSETKWTTLFWTKTEDKPV